MNVGRSSFNFANNYEARFHQPLSPPTHFGFTGNYDADIYHSSPPPTPISRIMSTRDRILESQREMCEIWIPPEERSPRQAENSHMNACHAVLAGERDEVRRTEQTAIESLLRKILEGQQQLTVNLNAKIDAVSTNLNGKIEAMYAHVQQLEDRISHIPQDETLASIDTKKGHRSAPVEISETSRPDGAVSTKVEATSSTPDTSVDRHNNTGIDRHSGRAELPYVVIPPSVPYKPKVPYPKARTSKKEMEEMRCKAMMNKIKEELPKDEKIDTSPSVQRLVKRMVQDELTPEQGALITRDISAICISLAPKKKIEKKDKAIVSEQVGAVIQKRLPEKLPDPGSFVLDCSIFGERFRHSLCDLGSGVNLMPLSVALRLGMTAFKPTRMAILFADRSQRLPVGILEDVPLKVGGCIIPTDFVILEYAREPTDPLLLGRPFLATAGATIDVRKGKVQLDLGDVVMEFDMNELRQRPTIDGKAFSVETLDDITAGYVDKLDSSEQVSMLEDWSGDQLFRTRDHEEVQTRDCDDVFVMEARIAEQMCRKRPDTLIVEPVSIDTTITCVDRYSIRAEPDLTERAVSRDVHNATILGSAQQEKAPHHPLPTPRARKRYTRSLPKASPTINKNFKDTKTVLQLTKPRDSRRALASSFDDCAGKRNVPPIPRSHPSVVPNFLGRSHAPTAYTPPWMRRLSSKKHSMPPSDPPDT